MSQNYCQNYCRYFSLYISVLVRVERTYLTAENYCKITFSSNWQKPNSPPSCSRLFMYMYTYVYWYRVSIEIQFLQLMLTSKCASFDPHLSVKLWPRSGYRWKALFGGFQLTATDFHIRISFVASQKKSEKRFWTGPLNPSVIFVQTSQLFRAR